jgi:hypothetical protein
MAAGPRAGRGSVAEMHAWLLAPGARGIGHRGALVLVTNIGTFARRADSYGGFGEATHISTGMMAAHGA